MCFMIELNNNRQYFIKHLMTPLPVNLLCKGTSGGNHLTVRHLVYQFIPFYGGQVRELHSFQNLTYPITSWTCLL